MTEHKVYILLTDTGTIFTRMIKFYTQQPLNHASLAFDYQLKEVYSFGRKKIRNPFSGGFVKENIRATLFRRATCAIYSCTVSDEQYKKMRKIINKMDKNQQEYKYNLLGLFAILFNFKLERKNAFFCSQFVASVLKESGSFSFNKPMCFITPHDLRENLSLPLVYEGDLDTYCTSLSA